MSQNPEGVERKILFNPFGVVKNPYLLFPELHSGLFMFNPFGIVRFVGNGCRLKLVLVIVHNLLILFDEPAS